MSVLVFAPPPAGGSVLESSYKEQKRSQELFYSCALCTHFTAKYSDNVFYANICTKNVQTPMLTVQVVRRCVFMVRMVYVAVVWPV